MNEFSDVQLNQIRSVISEELDKRFEGINNSFAIIENRLDAIENRFIVTNKAIAKVSEEHTF
jgi:uncharacterized protein (DUF2164 family)